MTLLSDSERRYGNTLFTLYAEALREGQRGRPPQVLPEGMKVRLKNNLKNKGVQKSKPGRKRPKDEAPHREHPKTAQNPGSSDIHANHVEAQNAAMRRRNSVFRRHTNTYAKSPTPRAKKEFSGLLMSTKSPTTSSVLIGL